MKVRCGVLFFLIVLHLTVFGRNINTVQNGLLDLRNHNWKKDGIVNISGNWEFYWNNFYSPAYLKDSSALTQRGFAKVPDFWNKYIAQGKDNDNGFGYATYHIKILCPPSPEPLALKLLTVQGAYTLFVNGKKLKETGKAGTTKENSLAKLKPAIINVLPENNVLDIVMQVSNFNDRKGGLWDDIKLGTQKQITQNTIKNLAFDFIVAGIFALAFIYNLILFLNFKKRYALLFFSILCLLIFVRILVTGEIPVNYLLNLNWEFVRRIEYISFYLSVPVMSLFSYFLFPGDFSKKALYIILPVSTVFVIISVFTSYYTYTYIVGYYQLFMIAAAFYGFYVYIRAVIRKRPGSILFLGGFVIFLATIINDVLNAELIINTVPLFYVGLVFFVVKLSLLLSRQFAQAFHDLEKANKQLADANATLAVLNDDIQQKNTELKKINQELDAFVHRTSHDLRAPLSSVKGVTYLMEDETNVSTLHDYAILQQKTLERMDNLIEDIIDFSKNKRLTLVFEEIDFSQVVNNAIEDHKHAKNAADIHIEVAVYQAEKFISDTRRISIVINNLISNAIKYSDLSKPKRYIHINISVVNNTADIEVNDNGIGIEENKLGKIFTMFYRATSSASGSGLGLYITKETVEKLNGTININSKKDEGTCIKVLIPGKNGEL